MKRYIKSSTDTERRWYVLNDLQGGSFGMYRLYTAEEWLDQVIDWSESDGTFDEDSYTVEDFEKFWEPIIRSNPQEFIDYISDLWELEMVEQGIDGHDYYTDFPEEP